MTYDQLLPLWLSTDKPENGNHFDSPIKFVGGFGYDTSLVGVVVAVQGFYSILINAFVFPRFHKMLGELRLFQLITASYFLLYLVTPYLVLLPENLRLPGIYLIMIWKCTFSQMAYPANAILLTNSAPSLLSLGTINGVAASTASLCRAFGPTISGFLYTLGLQTGYSGLAWWCSGAVTLIGAVVAMQLQVVPGRLDEKNDDVESVLPLPPAVNE